MHDEPRGAWRLVGGLLPVLAFTACAPGAGAEDAASAERAALAADTGGAVITQAVVPEVDIRIDGPGDCAYLEIDDLTPSDDSTDADTNLCSNNSTAGAVCPASAIANTADNPNFPGPDPASPATLGTVEAEYCDWADLDASVHLDPFTDNESPDDILESDGCLKPDGNTPSKGNFTVSGLAADPTGTWLYTLLERETSNGNESYEYYYLQNPTMFEEPNGCASGQYLFDPTPGDVRVVLFYQSTAGLPEAQAVVQVWEETSPSSAFLNPKELHQAGNWVTLTDPAVYPTINVAFNRQKSPGEDTEFDFDGTALASGIKVEMAVDIEAVFGSGCGLTRTMFALSSASEGGNDRIFDLLSPRVISTADIGTELTLYESCDEEFGYLVEIDVDGPVSDFSDFNITGEYDCGAGPVAFTVAYAGDTVAIPVTAETDCDIDVTIEGTGQYDGCDAELSDTVTVYPDVEAAGTLAQDCTGDFTWDLDLDSIVSSASGVGFSWSFDVGGVTGAADDSGSCTPPFDDSTDNCGDGSSTSSAASDGSAQQVDATLFVSDLQGRDLDGDGNVGEVEEGTDDDGDGVSGENEFCPDTEITVSGIEVHQPITVSITPQADATCSNSDTDPNDAVDDVTYDIAVQGGSGNWAWTLTPSGDAVIDATLSPAECDASGTVTDADQSIDVQDCVFGLGSDFCAAGDIVVTVDDNEDDACCVGDAADDCTDTVAASRVTSLDVSPLAP